MSSTEDLLAQRGEVYGDAVETHGRIAEVWSGILGKHISAHDVALCMVGLKLVRAQITPHHTDSHADAKGYAAIANAIVDSWVEPASSDLKANLEEEFANKWRTDPGLSGEDIKHVTENTIKLYSERLTDLLDKIQDHFANPWYATSDTSGEGGGPDDCNT